MTLLQEIKTKSSTDSKRLADDIIEESISDSDNKNKPIPKNAVRSVYTLIRTAASSSGQVLVMMLALMLVIGWSVFSANVLIEAVTIGLLLRGLLHIRDGSRPVLGDSGIRIQSGRLTLDEGLFAAGFLAACFIFDWPIGTGLALAFCLTNFIFQLTIMRMVKMVFAEQRFIDDRSRISSAQTVIIVGTGALAQRAADRILKQSQLATHVVGFLDYKRQGLWRYRDIPLIGHPDQLPGLVSDNQVDLLLIAVESDEMTDTTELFESAEIMGVPIGLLSGLFQPKIAKGQAVNLADLPMVLYRSAPQNKAKLLVKSTLDRISALIGLIMIFPIMAFTALAIRIDSKGPIFFRQTRSGLNGKPFKMIKFRTMGVDAEAQKAALAEQNEMSGPVFKIASDPRITKVGHYLRKYSVDELPQLFNVLSGEMSLVGPRPPLPKEVANMEPWQRRKLSMKPGVTCTWQVSGRNSIDFEDWMRLDLAYIDDWSLWEDAKLIARTIPTVLKGSGT